MKKIVLAIAFSFVCLMGINAQSQRVHEQIYNSSYKTASNPSEETGVRKLAAFKVDAITYLVSRTLAELSDSTAKHSAEDVRHLNNQLDSMAYYMYDYVNLFTKEYSKATTLKGQNRVMKIFRDASINHPLYNDNDKELVLAYFNREDYLTQFSLDTDWVKALAEAKEKLSK